MANALGTLFSEIAEAIRGKTGDTATMKPIEFPASIRSIPVYTGDGSESGGDGSGDSVSAELGAGLKMTYGTFKPDTFEVIYEASSTDFEPYPYDSSYYYCEISPAPCVLKLGEEYSSLYYPYYAHSTAETVNFPGIGNCVAIGKTKFFESDRLYDHIIGYSESQDKLICITKVHMESGDFAIYQGKNTRTVVEHGLGKMPDFVMVYYDYWDLVGGLRFINGLVTSAWGIKSSFADYMNSDGEKYLGGISSDWVGIDTYYGIDNMDADGQGDGHIYCPDESTFEIGYTNGTGLAGRLAHDHIYRWIAISGLGSSGGGSVEGVHYVTFMSEDGTTELYKRPVADGDNCADPVARGLMDALTKESTDTQNFDHSGWSDTPGGSADASILNAVTEDKTVYAAFEASTRYYTIRFFDGDTLLHTVLAEYGSTPDYVPTKEGYKLTGWEPELVAVTEDADYCAQWKESAKLSAYSWTQIASMANTGEAASKFEIGDTKEFTATTAGGTVYDLTATLVGINHDDLSDGSGKACLTFMVLPFAERSKFLPGTSSAYYKYGWQTNVSGSLRYAGDGTWYKIYESDVKNNIKQVAKKYYDLSLDDVATADGYVWSFSLRELGYTYRYALVGGNTLLPDEGEKYEYFTTGEKVSNEADPELIHKLDGDAVIWWTRTKLQSGTSAMAIDATGTPISESQGNMNYMVMGFCI